MEDHTADMILHGYAPLFEEALVEVALCMFELISPNCTRTTAAGVAVAAGGAGEDEAADNDAQQQQQQQQVAVVEVTGDTKEMLMFNLLNELLCTVWGERRLLVGSIQLLSIGQVRADEQQQQNQQQPKGEDDEIGAAGDASADDGGAPKQAKRPASRWLVRAVCRGQTFDRSRHEVGTEVKAMTMHALKCEEDERDMLFHCSCVVDI